MPHHSVDDALDRFVERQLKLQPEPPRTRFDSEWPSRCYCSTVRDGEPVSWRPARQTGTTDMFARLGEALDTEIHPDLVSFYSRYWSDPLPARADDGELSLLQVWNDEDMERLRSNLIGHALAVRKQKRPLTLFFACTEPDGNYFLSLDNATGEIWLEQPGRPPLRKLADRLADYIDSLDPLTIPDTE